MLIIKCEKELQAAREFASKLEEAALNEAVDMIIEEARKAIGRGEEDHYIHSYSAEMEALEMARPNLPLPLIIFRLQSLAENKEWWERRAQFIIRNQNKDFRNRLEENIKRLGEFGCSPEEPNRCESTLYKDFAPYSFGFSIFHKNDKGEMIHWISGGLIYHGPHDLFGSGSAPTFSVTIESTWGWSIHT